MRLTNTEVIMFNLLISLTIAGIISTEALANYKYIGSLEVFPLVLAFLTVHAVTFTVSFIAIDTINGVVEDYNEPTFDYID